jgi:hypothetical protein
MVNAVRRIRLVSISKSYCLMCKYSLISGQSALSLMIKSISDRSAFKARFPKSHKAVSVSAYHDDLRSFTQIAISVPDRRKVLTSDRMHSQRTNMYKSVRASVNVSNHLLYAQRRVHISQGLPVNIPNHLLYAQRRV